MTKENESFTNCLAGVIVSTIIALLSIGMFLIGLIAAWNGIVLAFFILMFFVSVLLDIYCVSDLHKVIKKKSTTDKER